MTAAAASAFDPGLHVVATAGHVDHGKSSLIFALTGMDPDRLAEEKARGLTIDLGFAWTELPSGREIGFVDVPGHERFVRTMLAGVGPVPLVLFVIAADEGWKPQSEEHLAIVDVLGGHGVVALSKADLVDPRALETARRETGDRMAGTRLEGAPIVPVSSVSGLGLDELRGALDTLIEGNERETDEGRPRLFVDRVFTIKGAGTVVTGTLSGGSLEMGDEVESSPGGARARVRGLQTHKRSITTAVPVSRVAVNLAGIERERVQRGDVIGRPGQWRSTDRIDARVRPVRGLDHALTSRGAYKLYAGSAEVDARLRLYGTPTLDPEDQSFAHLALARPLALDLFESFVLRESGRRETVAGGVVIDLDPPDRPGPDPIARLRRRAETPRSGLPGVLADERGAVRVRDVRVLTGVLPEQAGPDGWLVSAALRERVEHELVGSLGAFHAQNPLLEGAPLGLIRSRLTESLVRSRAPGDPELVESLLDELVADGTLATDASTIRLATHTVSLEDRDEDLERVERTLADGEPTPPTQTDLIAAGSSREVIEAAVRAGRLVRVSPELVLRPAFVAAAEQALRAIRAGGEDVTVSAFRERLATSRKYAVPLLEHFDRIGVTARRGDVRVLRDP